MISFSRDYEPFARERDTRIRELVNTAGIELYTARDHLLIEPDEISKDDGGFYQVYSPFARKWFELFAQPATQARVARHQHTARYLSEISQGTYQPFCLRWQTFSAQRDWPFHDALERFEHDNDAHVNIQIPAAGFHMAYQHALAFKDKIANYKEARDYPDRRATSQLSFFFKNGSLVNAQVIQVLGLEHINFKHSGGQAHFLKELVWREFYYHILYHRPEVETHNFLRQYDALSWENNEAWFQRWCEGSTGFPIVDAGMRELNQTGTMHNRVRMIVASFLTKDLLIDWRWGERYFMRQLLDGDLAPNNGGWQWAASTGCDPQPYFRIFNPWLQSARFDPDARYIKRFVSELKDASPAEIHHAEADRSRYHYPAPIVDHATQKAKALALYQSINKALPIIER